MTFIARNCCTQKNYCIATDKRLLITTDKRFLITTDMHLRKLYE